MDYLRHTKVGIPREFRPKFPGYQTVTAGISYTKLRKRMKVGEIPKSIRPQHAEGLRADNTITVEWFTGNLHFFLVPNKGSGKYLPICLEHHDFRSNEEFAQEVRMIVNSPSQLVAMLYLYLLNSEPMQSPQTPPPYAPSP